VNQKKNREKLIYNKVIQIRKDKIKRQQESLKNYSPPLQSVRVNNIILNNTQIDSTLALESTQGQNPFGEDLH